jgi:hypothetical protein
LQVRVLPGPPTTSNETPPSEAARNAARPFRIDTWRPVNFADIRAVKAQLSAGYPVMVGVVVDAGLVNLRRGDISA